MSNCSAMGASTSPGITYAQKILPAPGPATGGIGGGIGSIGGGLGNPFAGGPPGPGIGGILNIAG